MPRAKRKVAPVKKVKKVQPAPSAAKRQRFPNFLLGLTFVIVILLLISLFFRNSGTRFSVSDIGKLFTRSNSPTPTVTVTPSPEDEKAVAGSDYTVQAGDTIWSIAEEAYGSGFNMVDIVAANKLANPGQIETGMHLTLPKVEAKAPTRGDVTEPTESIMNGKSNAITQVNSQASPTGQITPETASTQPTHQKEYTVKKGDCLWTIAQTVYGDGFKWTKIAEANHLANPRIIHAGNHFVLPPL